MEKALQGITLCTVWMKEESDDTLASKIYTGENLPAFTLIDVEDKTMINRSRFNLHLLFVPYLDRES